jgi:CRP/FNR family transcriptional regulator
VPATIEAEQVKTRLLELFPCFREMPDLAVDEVIAQSGLKRAPAGTVLFTPGTACNMFPLVLEGVIRVSRVGARGRELPLYRVHPGESCILTTTCLLGDMSYTASGVVEADMTVLGLSQALFHRLIGDFGAFRTFVFQLFTERVMDLMQVIEEVAFRKLDERLAGLLLSKGNPVYATHQQLADELGSVREMVSRLLRSFEDRGWVVLRREQIELRDIPALTELSQ